MMQPRGAFVERYYAPVEADPFVGREPQLAEIIDGWARKRDDGAVCRMVVHGTAGIGSSSVAVGVAGRLRDRFPDGVLYLRVSDPTRGGAPLDDGPLRSALIQLGLPDNELPSTEEQRQSAYNCLTDGKRLLVIFDGVTNADQVAHLVPNSPLAMVVATTRRQLRTLTMHGWRPVQVPPLGQEASTQLLRAMLGLDFDAIEAPTLSALLRICGGHPLAVRIIGGVLSGQPEYAAQLVEEIRVDGVDAFDVDGVALIRVVLDSVYDGLPDELARAYRRLSANPGPDFSAAAAAVLLGGEQVVVRRTLRSLVDLNLLVRGQHGRFGFHPLVLDHARRMRRRFDPAPQRRALAREIIEYYRYHAIAWEQTVIARWREAEAYRQIPPASPVSDPETPSRGLSWLTDERTNLEAAVRDAVDVEVGFDEAARDLCFALWTPFHRYGHTLAWVDITTIGLEAARRLGDSHAVMQLESQRGAGHLAVGELDEAKRCFTASQAMATRLDHGLGQQSALEWLGKAAAARGKSAAERGEAAVARAEFAAALSLFDESKVCARVPGMVPAGQLPRVLALLALQRGRVLFAQGHFSDAVATLDPALTYFGATSESDNHAKVLVVLGQALLGIGDTHAARQRLEAALALFAGDGSLRRQAETEYLLVRVARTRWERCLAEKADGGTDGDVDPSAEIAHLRAAGELFVLLGDERIDVVRQRLAELADPEGTNRAG